MVEQALDTFLNPTPQSFYGELTGANSPPGAGGAPERSSEEGHRPGDCRGTREVAHGLRTAFPQAARTRARPHTTRPGPEPLLLVTVRDPLPRALPRSLRCQFPGCSGLGLCLLPDRHPEGQLGKAAPLGKSLVQAKGSLGRQTPPGGCRHALPSSHSLIDADRQAGDAGGGGRQRPLSRGNAGCPEGPASAPEAGVPGRASRGQGPPFVPVALF